MIQISKGNLKLGPGIWNTSTRPILDCKAGAPCAKMCYAMKAWRQYPGVRDAWTRNAMAWRRTPRQAADSVIKQIKSAKNPPKYFRIHVGGDFINQKHVDMWKYIAKECSDVKFRCFSKRWDLVYTDVPSNLIIGWSMWPGVDDTAPAGNRAWVQDGTETRIPKGTFRCPGKCEKCKVCWTKRPKHVWFQAH